MFCLAALLAAPAVSFAQQQEDDQQETYEVPELEAPAQSNNGGLAEEETQGAGSLGIQQEEGTGGRGGSTAGGTGTLGNPTPDGRDPGGNPDVPFDTHMNIAFLIGGLVFAFVVYRRRLKPVAVKS